MQQVPLCGCDDRLCLLWCQRRLHPRAQVGPKRLDRRLTRLCPLVEVELEHHATLSLEPIQALVVPRGHHDHHFLRQRGREDLRDRVALPHVHRLIEAIDKYHHRLVSLGQQLLQSVFGVWIDIQPRKHLLDLRREVSPNRRRLIPVEVAAPDEVKRGPQPRFLPS